MNTIGIFHPLLVHFPIAFLLLAFLLELLALRGLGNAYRATIPLLTLLGGVGAIASAITGYLLWQHGGYEEAEVISHRNGGISLAILSLLLYLSYKYPPGIPYFHAVSQGIAAVLVVITGHLGGALTHGEDYLSFRKPNIVGKSPLLREDALAFADYIQPLLLEKCVSCHGPRKQKSGLRLDHINHLLKGGKNGFHQMVDGRKVARITHRIQLPTEDKQHMPPRQKPQLEPAEIAVIEKWLAMGADPELRIRDLAIERSNLYPSPTAGLPSRSDWPEAKGLRSLSEEELATWRAIGPVILPLAINHPLLQVNCQDLSDFGDDELQAFREIEDHIASLRLSHTRVSDRSLDWLGRLPHLTRLYLDHTLISDEGLAKLSDAKELRYLNLVGTKVTGSGLEALRKLPNLQTVYLYQSEVSANDLSSWQRAMPFVRFDLGGYRPDTLGRALDR